LHEVSLIVDAGERVLLAGPNGSGKSTLFRALTGFVRLQKGSVELRGQRIDARRTDWRIRHGLGYLLQTRNVFRSLTVRENLALAADHRTARVDERRDLVLGIFPNLSELLERRAGLLSGGERQALAVGMVLMRKHDLLLIDEPTAGLAPTSAAAILEAIHRAQEEERFALVIVEHNLKTVVPWVSRAVLMNRGCIVAEESKPEQLLNHDLLEKYYFA
jgi:branched-chain amino acid transport system ATP-binding protein